MRIGYPWVAGRTDNPWDVEAQAPPLAVGEPAERPPNIVNVDEVEHKRRKRAVTAPLATAERSKQAGFHWERLEPGARGTPPHCHSEEEEVFVILEGSGLLELWPSPRAATNGVQREDIPIHEGHVIARPPATRLGHSLLAGDDGITMLVYGTRKPNDMCYYPRSFHRRSTFPLARRRLASAMNTRKLVPLSGVAAVALIIAGFAAAGSPPNEGASVDKVVAFYEKHTTSQTVSGALLSLGALSFLVFAGTFAARLRRLEADRPGPSALCLSGAIVLVVGLSVYAGLSIAIADVVGDVDGTAVQTLNVMADGPAFVFLITVGASVFLLGAAAAAFTTELLPRWLGWLAAGFATVGAIPSHVIGGSLDHIGLIAFAGLGLWTLIVGVTGATRPEGV